MAIQFSPLLAAQARGSRSGGFSVKAINLQELGERASPVLVLDDFRVTGRPFPPHPHAGFSAVTYVFEDSKGALRSRDSLGNDLGTGPGGIVWTQAGSGVVHEETPADPGRELHGLQVFVNLSPKNKLVAPRMYRLEKSSVPEWQSDAGDRVRVLVGSFADLSSPLVPAEPFDFLDVELQSEISFNLDSGRNAIVYVPQGDITVHTAAGERKVAGGHALSLYGSGGRVRLAALQRAHLVLLSGIEIRDPIVADGPFIMNEQSQLESAVSRYRAGEMGHLAPLSEG